MFFNDADFTEKNQISADDPVLEFKRDVHNLAKNIDFVLNFLAIVAILDLIF